MFMRGGPYCGGRRRRLGCAVTNSRNAPSGMRCVRRAASIDCLSPSVSVSQLVFSDDLAAGRTFVITGLSTRSVSMLLVDYNCRETKQQNIVVASSLLRGPR